MNLAMEGADIDWRALSAQLFVPLNSSPCRCQHRWEKGVLTRMTHCSRCVAIEAYQSAMEVST